MIFLTAIPWSIIGSNMSFFIAIFSFYLALAGWHQAKTRRGTPRPLEWISAG